RQYWCRKITELVSSSPRRCSVTGLVEPPAISSRTKTATLTMISARTTGETVIPDWRSEPDWRKGWKRARFRRKAGTTKRAHQTIAASQPAMGRARSHPKADAIRTTAGRARLLLVCGWKGWRRMSAEDTRAVK